jgi:hypothetical protein
MAQASQSVLWQHAVQSPVLQPAILLAAVKHRLQRPGNWPQKATTDNLVVHLRISSFLPSQQLSTKGFTLSFWYALCMAIANQFVKLAAQLRW